MLRPCVALVEWLAHGLGRALDGFLEVLEGCHESAKELLGLVGYENMRFWSGSLETNGLES